MAIETLRPASAAHARVALFDFDGTLSTIRAGWMDVMVPMMVEILAATGTQESQSELRAVVEEFVGRLTGKQTIYQMIELADQVRRRGGAPEDPLVYKQMYLDRLHERIADRLAQLRNGSAPPDRYVVPGARRWLETLRARGLTLYLASGTDHPLMEEEARLLDVAKYFNGGIYGALDDYKSFSKKILIERVIRSSEFRGDEFLGFGDGYVEIENVRDVGGVTVGIASDEPECRKIDPWKRERLIGVGADYIVPNYLCHEELERALFASPQ